MPLKYVLYSLVCFSFTQVQTFSHLTFPFIFLNPRPYTQRESALEGAEQRHGGFSIDQRHGGFSIDQRHGGVSIDQRHGGIGMDQRHGGVGMDQCGEGLAQEPLALVEGKLEGLGVSTLVWPSS